MVLKLGFDMASPCLSKSRTESMSQIFNESLKLKVYIHIQMVLVHAEVELILFLTVQVQRVSLFKCPSMDGHTFLFLDVIKRRGKSLLNGLSNKDGS